MLIKNFCKQTDLPKETLLGFLLIFLLTCQHSLAHTPEGIYEFTNLTPSATTVQNAQSGGFIFHMGGGNNSRFPIQDQRGLLFQDDLYISSTDYFNSTGDGWFSHGVWIYYQTGEAGTIMQTYHDSTFGPPTDHQVVKHARNMSVEFAYEGTAFLTRPISYGWNFIGYDYQYNNSTHNGYFEAKTWSEDIPCARSLEYAHVEIVPSSPLNFIGCYYGCPSGTQYIVKAYYFETSDDFGYDISDLYHYVPFNGFFYIGMSTFLSGPDNCQPMTNSSDVNAVNNNCFVNEGYYCSLSYSGSVFLSNSGYVSCSMLSLGTCNGASCGTDNSTSNANSTSEDTATSEGGVQVAEGDSEGSPAGIIVIGITLLVFSVITLIVMIIVCIKCVWPVCKKRNEQKKAKREEEKKAEAEDAVRAVIQSMVNGQGNQFTQVGGGQQSARYPNPYNDIMPVDQERQSQLYGLPMNGNTNDPVGIPIQINDIQPQFDPILPAYGKGA